MHQLPTCEHLSALSRKVLSGNGENRSSDRAELQLRRCLGGGFRMNDIQIGAAKVLALFIAEGFLGRFTIQGHSMSPSIAAHSCVSIIKTGDLVPGRCYVYISNSRLIIHRFTAMRHDHAVFFGDARRTPEYVDPNLVVGALSATHTSFRFHAVRLCNWFALIAYPALGRPALSLRVAVIQLLLRRKEQHERTV